MPWIGPRVGDIALVAVSLLVGVGFGVLIGLRLAWKWTNEAFDEYEAQMDQSADPLPVKMARFHALGYHERRRR
jgi:hypothetical protein